MNTLDAAPPGSVRHPPRAVVRLVRVEAIDVGATDWLTGTERRRLDAMASRERQTGFVAGHWLARQMAATWHDVAFGRVSVHRLPDGRPCVHLDGAPSPLSLSLSHSGGWILVGLAEAAIGVDVEVPRRARDVAALARRALSREEADQLAALSASDRFVAFHEHWALREARGKRTGEGMRPAASRELRARRVPAHEAHAISWRLGSSGAVAVALQSFAMLRLEDGGLLVPAGHWRFERAGH